ncbi:hypothetical protein [Nocardia wallacei]|uniref:hypothetical protein n=1 Tax=Nocardia wallacei TaxID=480035 RepID=UPI0024546784|nr:hypothetical protein [Nocardia wallacei]
MAVNRASARRRWAVTVTGAAVWPIIAAAGVAAEPVLPAGSPGNCTESRSAATTTECGGGDSDRKPPGGSAPPLPLQMLAPPPARSAPGTNTPAGALVPPAPGPAGDTPIVPAR